MHHKIKWLSLPVVTNGMIVFAILVCVGKAKADQSTLEVGCGMSSGLIPKSKRPSIEDLIRQVHDSKSSAAGSAAMVLSTHREKAAM